MPRVRWYVVRGVRRLSSQKRQKKFMALVAPARSRTRCARRGPSPSVCVRLIGWRQQRGGVLSSAAGIYLAKPCSKVVAGNFVPEAAQVGGRMKQRNKIKTEQDRIGIGELDLEPDGLGYREAAGTIEIWAVQHTRYQVLGADVHMDEMGTKSPRLYPPRARCEEQRNRRGDDDDCWVGSKCSNSEKVKIDKPLAASVSGVPLAQMRLSLTQATAL
jgi:hypothetical protein